jgi:hypothetical protein
MYGLKQIDPCVTSGEINVAVNNLEEHFWVIYESFI